MGGAAAAIAVKLIEASEVEVLRLLEAFLDMIGATKYGVNLFERALLCLWDAEVHERREDQVDTAVRVWHGQTWHGALVLASPDSPEHVKGVEADLVEEQRKDLVDDGVGDVLHLRGHAHGLPTDVH